MAANISILIITYNRPDDTLALLENLKMQTDISLYVGEILLLNNASSVSYVSIENFIEANKELPIKYISHHENLGVARGRNFLIKKALFPLLLVLDDDVVLKQEDAIVQVATLFSKPQFIENNTAVLTLNIFYYDTKERQRNALPHKHYEAYKEKEWFLTYYFTGAAHLMKKELFSKTGLYPENFFYGMEEYDLSYRIIEAGYTLGYDASVQVLHKESPGGRVTNKEKLSMMWYNKCVVAWRYLPVKYFFTTAIMWLFEYLKQTGFYIPGALKTLFKIRNIPGTTAKHKISRDALDYLKNTKARIWY